MTEAALARALGVVERARALYQREIVVDDDDSSDLASDVGAVGGGDIKDFLGGDDNIPSESLTESLSSASDVSSEKSEEIAEPVVLLEQYP